VKNHQSALALPAFFHMYPHNQRLIGFKMKEREGGGGFRPLSHLPDSGYCIAATILLSKVPKRQRFCHGPVKPHARAGRVVLNNLSEQIRDCLEHAEDCARQAAELPNSSPLRQDFLRLEKRWLELARSIEFGESLDTFMRNGRRLNIKPNV
jgi:hypothetical protein